MAQDSETFPFTPAQFDALIRLIEAASGYFVAQRCNRDPAVIARFGAPYEKRKEEARRMLAGGK